MINKPQSRNGRTVKEIIAACMCVDEYTINENTDLSHDLGADSLDMAELCMKLENEFRISIPDEQWEQVHTVGQIEQIVSSEIKKPWQHS